MGDPEARAAIEVQGLRHAYRGRVAIRDVSFTVGAGGIHGFVGPNGAGKTTTLKIVATLLKPYRGMVRVFGEDAIASPLRVRRMIGYMPDGFSAYRHMTVQEYLDFFAAAYGLAYDERLRVIDEVLTLTDMDQRRHDVTKALSRGMQQRLTLAWVLVHDPELLLLDEPASGLDPRARIELMEILRALRDMGKTVFISSHILAELADLCDAVTILDRGAVVYSGAMEGLLCGGTGEAAYELVLAEPTPAVGEALRAAEVVRRVEEDAAGHLHLHLHDDVHSVNRTLEVIMGAGGMIREFRREAKHLGQAFLDLTTAGVG